MFSNCINKEFAITCIIILLSLSSCVSKKEVVYFQNAKDFETIVDTDTFTPKFKVNDIVSVYVSTFDLEAVKPFNLFVDGGNSNQPQLIDYLVDIEGNIDYPVLGKVKLMGLTVQEAQDLFKEKLSLYLKDPIINIRILNFRVSILGQVRSPGRYDVSGERITILEAIALAGDLNIKGHRENILVIRDFNGTKTYTRVDLTNKELFNSPVYYLTQNDIVYVEPNNSAISSASGDTRIGTIISISSFLITTALIFVTRN
ncbi:MAG: polysaccharide biosynthesis/export family protein [Algibacter sp.]|uniref:polysaccharide biosynthesis/export family protein n=1 Tax=Algibacter sp. TaxID=1872428 RepID=UPI00262F6C6B|nr:polysaccharide biosynthesis/export family protein [Algibacter sp.]MDG1730890.1 polysaccharide biosynthesis/export family protein [Algibacter sp.]MDG2179392.1 polysaccharide biosynthesis/export family protein [Algibacter sp.]